MKIFQSLLFLSLVAVSLVSCTGDDIAVTTEPDPVPEDNFMTLSRKEEYRPSFENYETKWVSYYANNQIVADTVFNSSGEWISYTVRTVTPISSTSTSYNTSGTATATSIYTYDHQKRLTGVDNGPDFKYAYTYNSDNTITASKIEGLETINIYTYYYNANGQIDKQVDLYNQNVETLTYSDGVPVSMTQGGYDLGSFIYYDIPVPENVKPTITKTNNNILRHNRMEHAPNYCGKYLKHWFHWGRYEKEFNELNYEIHSKDINVNFDVDPTVAESTWRETFYYYT